MTRSLKKGPYLDQKIMNLIQKMNRVNDKKVIKTYVRRCWCTPKWWDILSRSTMEKNLFQFSLRRTWLVISLGNLLQLVLSRRMVRSRVKKLCN